MNAVITEAKLPIAQSREAHAMLGPADWLRCPDQGKFIARHIAVEIRPDMIAPETGSRFDQQQALIEPPLGDRNRGKRAGKSSTNDDQGLIRTHRRSP